ncbi:hypothetical protein J5N97_007175 [Dioscorea zingiberensis]|uniref:Uncharacterized protein n=1 Tax=Dioscorea zingiberensis TaxID=325984 RepID=A0A9D5HTZ4_9LILI|nr:hypothetical protein J5N97_007175 [Dioscorea zingiberensis]
MASVSSVIRMFAHVHWCEYVMNATMAHSRAGVSSAGVLAYRMLITVRNVLRWKRTGMDAPRLSIWAAPRLTSSMSEKNTVSRKDETVPLLSQLLR